MEGKMEYTSCQAGLCRCLWVFSPGYIRREHLYVIRCVWASDWLPELKGVSFLRFCFMIGANQPSDFSSVLANSFSCPHKQDTMPEFPIELLDFAVCSSVMVLQL